MQLKDDVVLSAYEFPGPQTNLGLTPFENSHEVLGGSKVKDGGEVEV